MSGLDIGSGGGGGPKKAVHVKWAGKTIALGTFQKGEAEDKCARAKALTRAWRSTMRPKPTREWVMLELERLGVRVVSGRLGRGKDEDEEDDGSAEAEKKSSAENKMAAGNNNMMGGNTNMGMGGLGGNNNMGMGSNMMGMMGMNNNMGMGNNMGMNSGDNPSSSNHRPLVGGGAAAAFNAAREDHYRQMEEKKKKDDLGGNQSNNDMSSMAGLGGNMSSGMGMGNMGSGGGNSNIPSFGVSVNPNQHYEMLKLHHMNLLNEIQETTLMMNLYQQQQLQQQQQMRNMGGGMGMGMMNQGGSGGMMNNQGNSGVGSIGNDSKTERRSSAASISSANGNADKTDDEKAAKTDDEKAALLKKIAELERSIASKRKTDDDNGNEPDLKKAKA
eukprot:CAMPEP_0201716376 /NCGR_PEP_ID=MMETSP0593-20130828/2363_1 /ASSEMBLY_ACC=CAM_ASM_000672 /TAXON_ID=267983 /ORGANISM="Skeletonema japonicum, Strain CCMP2506" /LENGTH=387 /DNA_ID=CAMNT_0048206167 /DNA_START=94 /DNA_END=1257 /DNA_ORIENTATION=-